MGHRIGENYQRPHDCTVRLWTTVENSGIAICAWTCANHMSSPIHKTYNNYTRI